MSRFSFRVWDEVAKEYLPREYSDNWLVIHLANEVARLDSPERWIVEQSTGLTDVEGKEIFEGDVVYNSFWKTKHAIVWGLSIAAILLPGQDVKQWPPQYLNRFDPKDLKVIGTIHDKEV